MNLASVSAKTNENSSNKYNSLKVSVIERRNLLELNTFPRHVRGRPNCIGAFDKFVKWVRFRDNNSKFHLLLYVDQRNVATAILV